MNFIIRFAFFTIFTFFMSQWYEKRRKNEILSLLIYFAMVALIFLF